MSLPSPPPPPPIDSRAGFAQAVHWGVAAAVARGARRILCCDADFAAWPLDDAALHALLVPWLRLPQRRLVLLAAHYDDVPRRHPRFVRWRRDWSHAIEPLQAPEDATVELPSLLLDDGPVVVELLDPVRVRGRAGIDAVAAQAWRERTDVWLQRSTPAFPVTALGI
jgi:hypothetical protein